MKSCVAAKMTESAAEVTARIETRILFDVTCSFQPALCVAQCEISIAQKLSIRAYHRIARVKLAQRRQQSS